MSETEVKNKNSYEELVEEARKLYNDKNYIGAIKLYKAALLLSKDDKSNLRAGLYVLLANSYYNLEDFDKSTYYYEEYLKLSPAGQASVFSRLAHYYYYLDIDKSIDYHNKSLNLNVSMYDSVCKLFDMTKSPCYSQQEIKEESEFEMLQMRNSIFVNKKPYTHEDKKNSPDKKLNIGYVSSDFSAHTMMNYIMPILQNHDTKKYNFFIFNCSEKEDYIIQQIKETGMEIVNCKQIDIPTLAKTIYDKKIDILIDLNGHTHSLSCAAFYKPAPIIIQYLGYINTLGIKEVDYILTDKFTIPEDSTYLYTEKPLYLDSGYWIYRVKQLPDLEESPFINNKYITFGCFNCSSKINDSIIFLWSKILEAVPNSKLIIYRTQLTKRIIIDLREKFAKRGINDDRVIFIKQKYNPHYKAYSLVDIALDTFPFGGMSITIESALMGVPTITLTGNENVGMQSKGAGRINHTLGLDELNAVYADDYIQNAVNLANDKEKLLDLKKNLREKVMQSPLIAEPKKFVEELESKYEAVWKEFCK